MGVVNLLIFAGEIYGNLILYIDIQHFLIFYFIRKCDFENHTFV